MAKLHHSETKDIQKVYAKMDGFGDFTRPNGKPLTGPDITFLRCFTARPRNPASRRAVLQRMGLLGFRSRGGAK